MLYSLYTNFSYSGSDAQVATVAIWFGAAMIIFGLLFLTAHILFAIAVYNDAQAKGNNDASMWGILVGVFGWIPAIIYLCIRNNSRNKLIICPNCGFTHRIGDFNCPQCGVANPFSQQFANPMTDMYKARAKKLLIAAIIIWAVAIILFVISLVCFLSSVVNMHNYSFAY